MGRRHRNRSRRFRQRSPGGELYLFLSQKNISAGNIEHIKKLTQSSDQKVKALADIVLEIAQLKPKKRGRMEIIAREHPDLFLEMVATLDDEFWDYFFFRYGDQPEWLHRQWEAAQWQIEFQAHGKSPCWCGSGQAYWLCCAERDDAFAEQLALEEREREWALNPDSIPWWHPDSRVDHNLRSSYELFYADPDHPLANVPPEWAGELCGVQSTGRKTQIRQNNIR